MLTLRVARLGPETSAVRATLDYKGVAYDTRLADAGDDELSLFVPAEAAGGDECTLRGFRAAFTFCSRRAHTMPSDPLCAGIVAEKLEWAIGAGLDALERTLEENAARGSAWLCEEFIESSAADFYLACRLRHMRGDGQTFDAYPALRRYMAQNPAESTQIPPQRDGRQQGDDELIESSSFCAVA